MEKLTKLALEKLSCNVVCSFEGKTHAEWETLRETNYGLGHVTLGGSDGGVVMDVNKYKDTPQLFLEKKGLVKIEVTGEAVEWGNWLEPVVADKFKQENPHMMVLDVPYLLQHNEKKFAVANLDRLLYNLETEEYGVLEIKTASEYVKDQWNGGNIPPSYYAQIQHYFFVTGLSWGYFGVLLGGNKYHQIEVQRNDEYINSLLFQEEMFMTRVELDQMPELTGSEGSTNLLAHLFPSAKEDKVVKKLDDDLGQLVVKRQELKDQMSELEKEMKECENKVKAALGEMKKATYEDGLIQYNVSWGNVNGREGLDTKRLKVEHPEIYAQYVQIGNPFRQFKITEKVGN